MDKEKQQPYGIAEDSEHLPPLTVTQEMVDEAQAEIFGTEIVVSLSAYTDSKWSRLFEQFYRERIVYVRNTNVLFLRFQYDYDVDLDRIKSEADLLRLSLHLCEKTWMTTERLHHFIESVGTIKKLNIYGL
jgi:hypothetical protein